jgi:chemotaxis protein histidine kinase CheA
MQILIHEDLDEDILTDLLEEINELYEGCEQTLIELELKPQDKELQRSLFRSFHTIKVDLGLVNFHRLSHFCNMPKVFLITFVKGKFNTPVI